LCTCVRLFLCTVTYCHFTVSNFMSHVSWATVASNSSPYATGPLSCLSETLVCYGQMVGWIKMPLGTEVGLGPGHVVLDGNAAPPSPESDTAASEPYFLAHVCCGQTAEWIRIPFGTEVGFSPGDIVLDGIPAAPTHGKGHNSPHFLVHVYRSQTVNFECTFF